MTALFDLSQGVPIIGGKESSSVMRNRIENELSLYKIPRGLVIPKILEVFPPQSIVPDICSSEIGMSYFMTKPRDMVFSIAPESTSTNIGIGSFLWQREKEKTK